MTHRSASQRPPSRALSAALPVCSPVPPSTSAPGAAGTPQPAAPSADAYRSSGQSPGITTLHLIGPGQVGAAFLRQLCEPRVRVVAISDASASVFDRDGVPIAALLAHKAAGRPLSAWPRAEVVPTELAVDVVAADLVVDATPSTAAGTEAAVLRGRAALQNGAFLVLCAKNALAAAAPEWLVGPGRGRVGCHAVLGGAGQHLVRELDELRRHTSALALAGNVTTTVIVQAIERGASIAEGIDAARALGLLETDATLDLDGSDAATKLRVVWGAVFGELGINPPPATSVERQHVRELDAPTLRERVRRGATTRLVARAGRSGADLRVAFEELPAGSPLAAPPDRVVYGYELPTGWRLHTGLAVGHQRTAAALLDDVRAALATAEVRR